MATKQLSDGALGGNISGGKVDGGGGGKIDYLVGALEGRLDLKTIEAVDAAVAAVGSCDEKSLARAFGGEESSDEEVVEFFPRPFKCRILSKNPFSEQPVELVVKQPAVKQPAVQQPVEDPLVVNQPAVKQPVEDPHAAKPLVVKQPVEKEVAGGKRKLSFTLHSRIRYQDVRCQLTKASLGADGTNFRPEAVGNWVSLVSQFTRDEDAVLNDNGVAPPSVAHVYSKSLLKASREKGVVQSLDPRFKELETEEVLGKNPFGNLATVAKKRGGINGVRYDKTRGTPSQRSVGYFYLC